MRLVQRLGHVLRKIFVPLSRYPPKIVGRHRSGNYYFQDLTFPVAYKYDWGSIGSSRYQ